MLEVAQLRHEHVEELLVELDKHFLAGDSLLALQATIRRRSSVSGSPFGVLVAPVQSQEIDFVGDALRDVQGLM